MEAFRIGRFARYGLGVFFVVAGVNHFVMPEFYAPLIPPYFPYPETLNLGAGALEVVLGSTLLLGNDYWRSHAALGIFLLLLAFLPSHVYFIQVGSCLQESLCLSPWIAWVRLIIVHPLLLLWAGFHHKKPRY
jgi:uncharacterized membrane protein